MTQPIFRGDVLRLDLDDDGIAGLCFDATGTSINKFDRQTLRELRQANDAVLSRQDVSGLMLTSDKDVFVVGADITEFVHSFKQEESEFRRTLLETHRLFADLEDLPFPTAAAINGLALGGGFEICLACDYRIMASTAFVGLPEIKLGIFPGWGGSIRLPRLIGVANAVEWIATGRSQNATAAQRVNAVDEVVSPDDLQSAVRRLLLREASTQDYPSRRQKKAGALPITKIDVAREFEQLRSAHADHLNPHYPALGMVLDAMEQQALLEREDAIPVEVDAFIRVSRTPCAESLVGLFLNDQALKRAARRYAKGSRKIDSIGIVGAGIMGSGIALQSALKGFTVSLYDTSEGAVQQAIKNIGGRLEKRVAQGRLIDAQRTEALDRIQAIQNFELLGSRDVVIEAVVEDVEIKQDVLSRIEPHMAVQTILTTNTSTISIDRLAGSLQHAHRFCGLHFFNPVHAMPLVEVIRGKNTSDDTIATLVQFVQSIGKNPIVVRDCPGFYVNRVLFPYLNAFDRLVKDGVDFERIDRIMEAFGWPMGPALLIDVVGIDTTLFAGGIMADGYPDRMSRDFMSANDILMSEGRLGQKNGKGYYRYDTVEGGQPVRTSDSRAQKRVKSIHGSHIDISDEDIILRMMIPLCIEVSRCLEEGIVDSPEAADMALVWGIGFPAYLGGGLRYIDQMSVSAFCSQCDRFGGLGAAYRPTVRLRQMAQSDERFFQS